VFAIVRLGRGDYAIARVVKVPLGGIYVVQWLDMHMSKADALMSLKAVDATVLKGMWESPPCPHEINLLQPYEPHEGLKAWAAEIEGTRTAPGKPDRDGWTE
jgi:hypothetical protein